MKEYKSMIVTPKMAQEFLKLNTKNRIPSRERVNCYARNMIRGDWNEDNDDPITINKFNVLENGQHRLMAVVKANKPIRFLVVTGGEPAGETYDRGRPRSVSDALKISGRIDTANLNSQVAVVRLLARFGYGKKIISDTEVERYLLEHGSTVLEAIRLCFHGKSASIAKKKEIQLATYLVLRSGVESWQLEPFFVALNTGFMTSKRESPAILLRNAIMEGNSKILPENRKGASNELFLIAELAIRDYLNVRQRTRNYHVNNNTKSIYLPAVAISDSRFFEAEERV